MRKKQPSLTAAGIAVVRALESEKPADERICYDPLSRHLVPSWIYHVFGFFIKIGYAERRGPGVIGFLVVRERYIDDLLEAFLDEGIDQLVILGAGFDSRPYRFDLEKVRTFEVDHPYTQMEKREKLKHNFEELPETITYVPMDFNDQSLENQLIAAGFNPSLKTLFIWQGVTMYLSSAAVDDILSFVVSSSAPGSAIVFDYVYRELLESTKSQSEITNMRRYRFLTGEGLTFGVPEGEIDPYLKTRGFHQVKDVNINKLKTTYFTGKNAHRHVMGGYGIVVGIV
jgi:methyltransferase (TIGR00027 family)